MSANLNKQNIIKLKYIASINDEALGEDTDPNLEINYIDISNVDSAGKIDTIATHLFSDAPSRARRVVKKGDVIISTVRTYLQAIAAIEQEVENLIVSTGFAVIRPKSKLFHQGYCKYALRESSFLAEVQKRSTGVSYPAINANDLGDISLFVPSFSVQAKISDFLGREFSKIDSLIVAKKSLVNLIDEKRQKLVTQAVTKGLNPKAKMKDSSINWIGQVPKHWELKRIKYVSNKIGSGVTPKGGAEVYQSEGIPILRSQNIHFDGLKLDDVAFISEEVHQSMYNSQVRTGDVLLNITGASIGRCYYVEGQFDEANVNQHVCIIRPNNRILTKYLYLFLSSECGQIQIALSQVGGGREGLNFEDIKDFSIPLPSLKEQEEIVAAVEKTKKEITLLEEKTNRTIELLREKRESLITSAVTGKIEIS